ncbi:hypothetical protein MGYG_08778 [Nannizzia gypsea CBS 118893]|uniref:Uncharacterized protein n=1 Tax=Arthroderma gypseum (strain ATCC MYA-4604 / CBS 118893) TaxID=535722 RepID=E4V6Z2_ARTGP|nr:hypothetical protein MGYG_08778 [Nannizzia gypsea CBS 118893]EFQ96858.1 hypothetical protein MGYG_08778 [Nannizzia gypsea CBS 118893]
MHNVRAKGEGGRASGMKSWRLFAFHPAFTIADLSIKAPYVQLRVDSLPLNSHSLEYHQPTSVLPAVWALASMDDMLLPESNITEMGVS